MGRFKRIDFSTFAVADYAGNPSGCKCISEISMMSNEGSVAPNSMNHVFVATSINVEYIADFRR